MVMVRAVLPSGSGIPIDDDYNIIDEPVRRHADKNRRCLRPVALIVLAMLMALLVLVAGSSRWTTQVIETIREHHVEGPAVVLQPTSSTNRESLSRWVPKMEAGLVDAMQGKVPTWHQCWSPLCKPCEVPEASAGALHGLYIFILSHAGKAEQELRMAVRSTWGKRAETLGAHVQFVLGDTLQQWGKDAAAAVHSEMERHGDIRLLRIVDFQGSPVEDSYRHLAYKVSSLAASALRDMGPGTWMMKVDTDTYVNLDRLALDVAKYQEAYQSGAGAWQYAGYHNRGGVKVRTSTGPKKKGKEAAWVETEYGAKHTHYPPYAFGAAGWLLGRDALQTLVTTAADPSVLRPKVNEDAMVGALLQECRSCSREHWAPCQILGGTSFPFASLTHQGGCPTLLERIGMAVADGELASFRCLITISELKRREHLHGIHNIISFGEL